MKALSVESVPGSVDGEIRLVLTGELDLSTADRVERELAEAEAKNPDLITLDLRGLAFIDSTGLRVVLSADGRARKDGRRLEVVPGPPPVHRVFRIALLDRRIAFVERPDVDDIPVPDEGGTDGDSGGPPEAGR